MKLLFYLLIGNSLSKLQKVYTDLAQDKDFIKRIENMRDKIEKIQKLKEKNVSNKKERKLNVGGGAPTGVTPTIINIPVPKIKETELEVVHVFPQGYPGANYGQNYGGYGGYGGQNSNLIPSYSVSTYTDGQEKVNNFWGFNPRKKLI